MVPGPGAQVPACLLEPDNHGFWDVASEAAHTDVLGSGRTGSHPVQRPLLVAGTARVAHRGSVPPFVNVF